MIRGNVKSKPLPHWERPFDKHPESKIVCFAYFHISSLKPIPVEDYDGDFGMHNSANFLLIMLVILSTAAISKSGYKGRHNTLFAISAAFWSLYFSIKFMPLFLK
jgi:hypothetical protein